MKEYLECLAAFVFMAIAFYGLILWAQIMGVM